MNKYTKLKEYKIKRDILRAMRTGAILALGLIGYYLVMYQYYHIEHCTPDMCTIG